VASLPNDVTAKVLADYTTAPIDERLRATLGFLRKMTLEHDALGPDDARAVLATGVSREALADAINVAYLFNIYDRLADTLGWDVPALGSGFYESSAKRLLARGYR
jgi:alkylhydroperoxidase family enzyme